MTPLKIPLVFEHSESSSSSNASLEPVLPPSGQRVADSNLAWAKKVGRGKQDSETRSPHRETPLHPTSN